MPHRRHARTVATRGQRDLLAVRLPLRTVATLLGVSRALVGKWREGALAPTPAQRENMQAKLGIPIDRWTAPAADTSDDQAGARRAPAHTVDDDGDNEPARELPPHWAAHCPLILLASYDTRRGWALFGMTNSERVTSRKPVVESELPTPEQTMLDAALVEIWLVDQKRAHGVDDGARHPRFDHLMACARQAVLAGTMPSSWTAKFLPGVRVALIAA